MEKVLNIAKEFINDPSGDYKYLGELEQGKHFVEYMFTDDCIDGDVALCVGGPQCLVVTDGKCQFADNDECVLAMRHISAKKDFVMAKENIEKSYNFGASEFNREAKRLAQERLKQGLPVSLDIPNDADAEDLTMLNAFDKWLRDGLPVE